MDKTQKQLRSQSKTLDPVLNLGKNGLSESVITEVKRMLKQKKLIKVRLNAGILETGGEDGKGRRAKAVAKELAEKADAVLVDCVGHVVALAQRPKTSSISSDSASSDKA